MFTDDDIKDVSAFLREEIVVRVHVRFPDRRVVIYRAAIDAQMMLEQIRHLQTLSEAERSDLNTRYIDHMRISAELFATDGYVAKLDRVQYVQYLVDVLSLQDPMDLRIVQDIYLTPGKIEILSAPVEDIIVDPASSSRGEAIDHFDPPAMWSADVGVVITPVVLCKMPAVTEFSFKKYIETICFMTLDYKTVSSLKPNTAGKIPIISDDKFYPILSESYDGTWFSLFVIQNIGGRVNGVVLSDCHFRPGNILTFGNAIAIPESKLDLTRKLFSFKKVT